MKEGLKKRLLTEWLRDLLEPKSEFMSRASVVWTPDVALHPQGLSWVSSNGVLLQSEHLIHLDPRDPAFWVIPSSPLCIHLPSVLEMEL